MDEENTNIASEYTENKIHEVVLKKYKMMRGNGRLSSIEDIYLNEPTSRLEKDNYSFAFDVMKNNIEEKMMNRGKLQKM